MSYSKRERERERDRMIEEGSKVRDRARARQDMRIGGQEDRRTGGQEDRRTGRAVYTYTIVLASTGLK